MSTEQQSRGWSSSSLCLLVSCTALLAALAVLATPATAQSGKLLKDINKRPGANPSSSPHQMLRIGLTIFFAATDAKTGTELYRTLGLSGTTKLVKDLSPGAFGSSLLDFADAQGTLFFIRGDRGCPFALCPPSTMELWKSDGTTAGTVMIKQVGVADPRSFSTGLTAVGKNVFFAASDPKTGVELWRSDGTAKGTVLVKDIWPGIGPSGTPNSSTPFGLMDVNGTLFFTANDAQSGWELWKSDGTAQGTVLVKDIRSGGAGSVPSFSINWGGTLYFAANDGVTGLELWKSDGTAAGTVLVKDIWPGSAPAGFPNASQPNLFTAVGKTLYFRAHNGVNGIELWKTNGTTAGTVLVKDIRAGLPTSAPTELAALGSTLVFAADDGKGGRELWKSNGTATGTVLVKDIWGGSGASGRPNSSSPTNLTASGATVFFAASNGIGDRELWKSNGTAAGTVLVKDIRSGSNGSYPSNLVVGLGGRVVFSANDGVTGVELWSSDGTASGTRVTDVNPPVAGSSISSRPTGFTDAAGTTYLAADDGTNGLELWKTDGTTTGTVLVKDISPGLVSSSPRWFTLVGDTVFFSASDGIAAPAQHGTELWKTDGTAAGTVLVKDINQTVVNGRAGHGSPHSLVAMRGWVFFAAFDGVNGSQLWRSDGTATGTVMVKKINSGATGASVNSLFAMGNTLFFSATDGVRGWEMWKSDGTAAGTVLVKDISPGGLNASVRNFTAVGSTLFFTAIDGQLAGQNPPQHGMELWKTDGTTTGTVMVKDINTAVLRGGVLSSSPRSLVAVGNLLLFVATDATTGAELWKSDGTTAGTVRVKDIWPGLNAWGVPNSSSPTELVVIGSTVLFTASTPNSGRELWKSDGTAAGTVLVKDIVPGAPGSGVTRLVAVGSRQVFFTADDGTTGAEIWRSDGTAAGTKLFFDLRPGRQSSGPMELTLSRGKLLVSLIDALVGREVFTLDPGATYQPVGRGCRAAGLAPTLEASDPVLGGTTRVAGTRALSNGGILAVGVLPGRPIALPAGTGGVGCTIYVDLARPFVPIFLTPQAGNWSFVTQIPNTPASKGRSVVIQAVFGPSGTAPLGLDLTRGVVLTLGQ